MNRSFRFIIATTLLTALMFLPRADAQTITTIAGSGIGDGKLATEAYISASTMAFDLEGNLILADTGHHRIRKIDAKTGIITTIAGTGAPGYNGDNIPATTAKLYRPSGIAFDREGNLYTCDSYNLRIRKIDAKTGLITTVAGNGKQADTIPGTVATEASFQDPADVAVDVEENIYVSTFYIQNAVWKIDAKTGLIDIFAGETTSGVGNFGGFGGDGGPAVKAKLSQPHGIAFDKDGNLYISDTSNSRVRKVNAKTGIIITVAGNGLRDFKGDGEKATNASLYGPRYVHVDAQGNLYISDYDKSVVRKADAKTGIITTVAGTLISGFNGDNIPAVKAQLRGPSGLTTDFDGNLYIVDSGNLRIRKVDAKTGVITTIAGRDIPDKVAATETYLHIPTSVVTDSSGNLYIATFRQIRKVDAKTGMITTLRLPDDYLRGVTVDAKDNLYVAYTFFILKVDGKTGKETIIAGERGARGEGLNGVEDLNFDSKGNLYIADMGHHRVLKLDAKGDFIIPVAGNGNFGFGPDGTLATNISLAQPYGIAIDSKDDIYISDTYNHRIRKVNAKTGIIGTIAGIGPNANPNNPFGGYAGDGGAATEARLNIPRGLAIDGKDNVYIADKHNHRIRRVDAKTGIITTVAGNGDAGFSGDGENATEASLSLPEDVWIDSEGNLYIADTGNNRIRLVKGVAAPMAVSPKEKQLTTLGKVKQTLLLQNFPNPFNPETWIPYQLAEESDVTLTIYNIKGELIRTISLGKKPAGVYISKEAAIHWDGRNDKGEPVGSGIYLYTIQVGEYTSTRKMLLLK